MPLSEPDATTTPSPIREAILSLGSNQGDRLAWLKQATFALLALPRVRAVAISPVYETEPVDEAEGGDFLNGALIMETDLPPHALLNALRDIERLLGRTRGPRPGLPRTLDLDLIALGDIQCDTPSLVLPHPRARLRRFVLQPLADIRPEYIFPGDTRTVSEILRALPTTPAVRLFVP